jgi:succinoglycan biosynthesis protein ExoU
VSLGQPVAVIITAKDAALTAGKAVASALAQRLVREVIFVDDGSSDATAEIARAADDGSGRLKVLRLEVNRGPSFGRNLAIAESRAPYFCILDADDFFAEDRLERMFAAAGEGWDLLADDILFCAEPDAASVYDRLLPDGLALPCDIDLVAFVEGNLPRAHRRRRELGFLKPVVRRAFVETHGVRYDERLRLGEDLLYYARCLGHGGILRVVPACGYHAVQYPTSLSALHTTADVAALYQALMELNAEPQVAGRLGPYVRTTRDNLALRQALDSKKSAGWGGFFNAVGRSPASIPHIVRTVARDKLGAALARVTP